MCGRKTVKSFPFVNVLCKECRHSSNKADVRKLFVECTFYHFHSSCTVIRYKRPYTLPKLYKQHRRVVNDKALYSGDPSFKFESGNRKC